MAVFGALMLVFVADDAFMVHESIGPYLLGIPQVAFYLVYACTALWVLKLFRQSADRSVTKVYVLGGGLLATSVLIDLVRPDLVPIEDTAKLLGTLVFVTVPVLTYAASRGDVLAPARPTAARVPQPRPGSGASVGGVS